MKFKNAIKEPPPHNAQVFVLTTKESKIPLVARLDYQFGWVFSTQVNDPSLMSFGRSTTVVCWSEIEIETDFEKDTIDCNICGKPAENEEEYFRHYDEVHNKGDELHPQPK